MEYLFPAVQFVTITISAESPARIVIGLPSKVLVEPLTWIKVTFASLIPKLVTLAVILSILPAAALKVNCVTDSSFVSLHPMEGLKLFRKRKHYETPFLFITS